MPRRKAGLKRQRVDRKKHLRNTKSKQQLKKTIKNFLALLSLKKTDEAKSLLGKVYSLLDKAAKKKIIHPNTAQRKKSGLAKRILKNT